MMAKLKPFYAGINTYVSRNIHELLGQPSHIRQASVIVLGATKKVALEYVGSLPGKPIGSPYAPEVRVASSSDVEALAAAGLFDAQAVFVTPITGGEGNGVVRIDADGPRLIGKLLRDAGRWEFEPAGTVHLRVTPADRERLARHLYLQTHGPDWRDHEAVRWDHHADGIDYERVYATADEIVAVLEGK